MPRLSKANISIFTLLAEGAAIAVLSLIVVEGSAKLFASVPRVTFPYTANDKPISFADCMQLTSHCDVIEDNRMEFCESPGEVLTAGDVNDFVAENQPNFFQLQVDCKAGRLAECDECDTDQYDHADCLAQYKDNNK